MLSAGPCQRVIENIRLIKIIPTAAISMAMRGVSDSDIPDTSSVMISHWSRWLAMAPTPMTKPLVMKAIKTPNPKPVRTKPIRMRINFSTARSDEVEDDDMNTYKIITVKTFGKSYLNSGFSAKGYITCI